MKGLRVIACVAVVFSYSKVLSSEQNAGLTTEPNDLRTVRSWGLQLQKVDVSTIAHSNCDLVVTDLAPNGQEMSPEDLARMREPGSMRPIRIAYLSIGEAEEYRFYWDRQWNSKPPEWLGRENPEWKGNYAVRYWNPNWQDLLVGGNTAFLQRIIGAGFDGVFLDKVDAFEDWARQRPTAMQDMLELVERIASAARQEKPGFLILAQNGGRLLELPAFRSSIDGFVREDLFFGAKRDKARNSDAEVAVGLRQIAIAQSSKLPVFVIEYIHDNEQIAKIREQAERLGFIPLVADRALAEPLSC